MPGAINHVIIRGLIAKIFFLTTATGMTFLVDLKKSFFDWLQVLLIRTSNKPPWGSDAESFGRNCPGISVYPGPQSRRPSSEVKNLQKSMMLNY
jgi:hypothetical protein